MSQRQAGFAILRRRGRQDPSPKPNACAKRQRCPSSDSRSATKPLRPLAGPLRCRCAIGTCAVPTPCSFTSAQLEAKGHTLPEIVPAMLIFRAVATSMQFNHPHRLRVAHDGPEGGKRVACALCFAWPADAMIRNSSDWGRRRPRTTRHRPGRQVPPCCGIADPDPRSGSLSPILMACTDLSSVDASKFRHNRCPEVRFHIRPSRAASASRGADASGGDTLLRRPVLWLGEP